MERISPREYYNEYGEQEWERLSTEGEIQNQLEFERTVELLIKYLPSDGHVLDAGGAAGRYSKWLADRGYTVSLVDLSETQLRIAAEKQEKGILDKNISISQQSITDLSFKTDTFDAILCTGGPLSHVTEKESRKEALREFKRVSKTNSPIFISVMGLLSVLSGISSFAPEYDETKLLPLLVKDGLYDSEKAKNIDVDTGFTQCKFFRSHELRDFLESNGLQVEKMRGLESIASQLSYSDANNLTQAQEERIRESVNMLGDDEYIADISSHILAICYNRK